MVERDIKYCARIICCSCSVGTLLSPVINYKSAPWLSMGRFCSFESVLLRSIMPPRNESYDALYQLPHHSGSCRIFLTAHTVLSLINYNNPIPPAVHLLPVEILQYDYIYDIIHKEGSLWRIQKKNTLFRGVI